jgi:hypothetical protein
VAGRARHAKPDSRRFSGNVRFVPIEKRTLIVDVEMSAKVQKRTELIGCSSVDGNPNNNDNQNDRHPVLERHSLYGELSRQELQERIHSQHLYVVARLKISYLLPI